MELVSGLLLIFGTNGSSDMPTDLQTSRQKVLCEKRRQQNWIYDYKPLDEPNGVEEKKNLKINRRIRLSSSLVTYYLKFPLLYVNE